MHGGPESDCSGFESWHPDLEQIICDSVSLLVKWGQTFLSPRDLVSISLRAL